MTIREMFDKMEDSCDPHDRVGFDWSAKGIGFGQMYFYVDKKDGYVHCDNERMSRAFLKETLCKMVDNCVLDEPSRYHPDSGPEGKPPGYNPQPIIDNPEITL